MSNGTASEPQLKFIRDLLTERAGLPEAEVIRERLNRIVGGGSKVSSAGAREVIDTLKALAPPAIPQQVPPGYYAITDKNDPSILKFFRVKTGNGHWSGKTFVDAQAGGDFHPIQNRGTRDDILARIAQDPDEAGLRYAQELGRCSDCNRVLTDEESRKHGKGPWCRNK